MTRRAQEATTAQGVRRIRDALARRFAVDARALAALRIALGVLLLADLLLRARDLRAFYTDVGVLPRALLAERFPAFARLSLHTLSGATWAQAALFLLAAVGAVALLLGYRTRVATAVSLVLLVSLHLRNPLVLNAGDGLLRRLLFWGLFLPLGRRWSVDAARGDRRSTDAQRDGLFRELVTGIAAAALLVQVLLVYLVNAVVKLRGDLWLGGDAVRYVFSLDQLTVLFGDVLVAHPGLLRLLAHVWLAMLLGSPLLVLATRWSRAALVALFGGAHLGMLLTMNLGLFPLVSIAALLPFLPPAFWDRVTARAAPLARQLGARTWPGRVARVDAFLPSGCLLRIPPRISRIWAMVSPVTTAIALAVLLVWNATALGYVDAPNAVSSTVDPGEYRWDMFAPEPRGVDGWYVVPGELETGERVDAFRWSAVSWDRPPDVADGYPNQRWLVYLLDLRYRYPVLRPGFAEHLCDRWNAAHEDDLVRLTVYYVEQPTRLDGPEPTRRVELLAHACGDGAFGDRR